MFENVERLWDFHIPIIRLSVFCCFFVSGKTMIEVLSLVYCPWCLSDCSHIQIMSASFQSVKNMLNHETALFFLSWSHLRSVDSQVRCPSHVSRSHVSYVSWAATQDCLGSRVTCLMCHSYFMSTTCLHELWLEIVQVHVPAPRVRVVLPRLDAAPLLLLVRLRAQTPHLTQHNINISC